MPQTGADIWLRVLTFGARIEENVERRTVVVGKTVLATALGHAAIRRRFTTTRPGPWFKIASAVYNLIRITALDTTTA